MSVNLAPNSRLLLVSVLVCAAVMCSASPIITQVDNEGKHNILRSLYMPYNQDPRLPTETGGQTGTNNKTETSGNFGEASSIIDHQSNLPQLSYDPDNKRSGTGIAQVWRGQSAGGMRPSSSIYTRQILDGPQPRVNYLTLNRKSYNYPPIIRKSSLKEAGSPFYQGVSQVWPPEYSYSPYNEAQDHRAGDKTVRKYSDSLLSPPTGVYWTARLPAPHYSGFKETNELTAAEVQSTSSRIQSGESLGLPSQTAPRALSISETLDASVVRSNPSPETLTPSIADLSQGVSSESTDKTQIYKKAKSYLFKDSQTSFHRHEATGGVAGDGARIFSTTPHEQEPSATRGYSRLSSNLRQIQQSHQNDPTKEVQLPPMNRPLYQNVVYYSAQTHSFRKYLPAATVSFAAPTPTQRPLYPASGTTLESFASMDNIDSQYSNDPSREKPVAGRPIDEPTKGTMHDYKPAQSTKTLYGFRGFESPARSAAKEPAVLSFSDGRSFRQYSFNKKQDYKFKMANMHSSLSPKYSFGLRGASTTAKPVLTPTSPPPDLLHIDQTTTVSTSGAFSSGFKDVRSESNTHMESNQNHRQFRITKRIYGLKGFSSRPLEGAEALVGEPDKAATFQQDFEGFELGSSQIWQPKSSRIHRWYDQTSERERGTSIISTQSRNKPQSEDLKPPLKAPGSVESVKPGRFSPDKYKKNYKTYAFLGFQPVPTTNGSAESQTHWKYTEQDPTTASPTHKASSAYLTSAGGLTVESSLKYEPLTSNKSKPVSVKARQLNISTSSMVRGKRVKGKRREKLNESISLSNNTANVAILKSPVSVKAVTYTDILGSASFSSFRVTTQEPTTTADEGYFPNTSASTKPKEEEQGSWEGTSTSAEENAEDGAEDLSGVEEKQQSVKSEGEDAGVETFDAFLDGEGSRNEHFNHVLSTDTSKRQTLREDISELYYLQKATGNISFKSMNMSPSDK